MKTFFLGCILLGIASVQASSPSIVDGSVSMDDAGGNRIKISYVLSGEPAVVTVDVQTNAGNGVWSSIGGIRQRSMSGSVNRLVTELGVSQRVVWKPYEDWEGREKLPSSEVRVEVKAWATNAPPDYWAVSLIDGTQRYYLGEDWLPGGIDDDCWRKEWLLMRRVHAAGMEFIQGSLPGERDRKASMEGPVRTSFTSDYYLGVFEFTQWQYRYLMDKYNPNKHVDFPYFTADSDTRPLENEGLFECLFAFGKSLSNWPNADPLAARMVENDSIFGYLRKTTKLDGYLYLPTEAQWEFACRAGEKTTFNNGQNIDAWKEDFPHLHEIARFAYNSGRCVDGVWCDVSRDVPPEKGGTARVGSYKANAWGFYDMHGNVAEWCADRGWNDCKTSEKREQNKLSGGLDPVGFTAAEGWCYFARGGSWKSASYGLRTGCRDLYRGGWDSGATGGASVNADAGLQDVGFRVCYQLH